jgi:hypothetical protein
MEAPQRACRQTVTEWIEGTDTVLEAWEKSGGHNKIK